MGQARCGLMDGCIACRRLCTMDAGVLAGDWLTVWQSLWGILQPRGGLLGWLQGAGLLPRLVGVELE